MSTLNHLFMLLLLIAYLSANGLCLLAYWPQLRAVILDPVARRKIVPFTWWVWTFGGATECLYAFFGADQLIWAGIALIHMLACAIIATLGTWPAPATTTPSHPARVQVIASPAPAVFSSRPSPPAPISSLVPADRYRAVA